MPLIMPNIKDDLKFVLLLSGFSHLSKQDMIVFENRLKTPVLRFDS